MRKTFIALFSLVFSLGVILPAAHGGHSTNGGQGDLAAVERLLEKGDGETALRSLEPILKRTPKSARAVLARSTAQFLLGNLEEGEADLRRSLRLDPTLVQAWLNFGALRMAEGDNARALDAFTKVRQLDPSARDNALNIGTAQLLLGEVELAQTEFANYLMAVANTAEANLLVAKNYALAGLVPLATQHAAAAIRKDERQRLALRTDPAFSLALDHPAFQELLARDEFSAPAGSLSAWEEFETPYDNSTPAMTGAVIDALYALGIPFDHRVEATPEWALIWTSSLRIKIAPASTKTSRVTLIAPPRSHTRKSWQDLQNSLFGQIAFQLAPKLPTLRR